MNDQDHADAFLKRLVKNIQSHKVSIAGHPHISERLQQRLQAQAGNTSGPLNADAVQSGKVVPATRAMRLQTLQRNEDIRKDNVHWRDVAAPMDYIPGGSARLYSGLRVHPNVARKLRGRS